MQTPVVAKLYRYEKHYVLTPMEFAFYQIQGISTKGYTTPIQVFFDSYISFIVWQLYFTKR